MAFSEADKIIGILKKRLGLDENTYAVLQIWEREFAPAVRSARLVAVKRGQLVVEVDSSAHFQELRLRKRGIIDRINQYFGRERVVKDIRIQLKK